MSDARKAAEERLQRKFQMATSVLDALQTSVSDARRALSDVASAAWDAVEAGQAARTPQITDEMVERAAEALRPGLFTLSLSGYERRFDSYGEETREAWAKVEAVTAELIREVEKNRDAARVGKKLTAVPDGSGRPGYYKTAWVDDPGPTGSPSGGPEPLEGT